ncbi:MAG: DNA translocase FtsK 4TM domain-containing protein [Bacillota bacterium]|nr:DNA translocase FtsK 4TM domain-containing protein [Bacillota bacterium]
MAGTRKGSGRPPGSRNKNNGKKTAAGKTKSRSTTGRGRNNDSTPKTENRLRDEIVSLILVAVGIFLIIAFQTKAAGAAGLALSHFFKGCFGFAAYILPYYFIIYGILLFMKKTIHTGVKSAVLLFIIFLMISLINSARFINAGTLTGGLSKAAVFYNNGMVLDDGGLFGMAIGGLIVKFIGTPGLYILSVVVIIICLLLIIDTPVSRFLESIKAKKERRASEREERRLEKEREHELYQQQIEMERIARAHRSQHNCQQDDNYMQDDDRAGMSAGQKKIMGYMNDDGRVYGKGNIPVDEELDFSLGEDKEKAKAPEAPEAEQFVKEPIIVGGFSPKAVEEKLTKSEAAKIRLNEEDFNNTAAAGGEYKFPPIDLLKKASKKSKNAAEEENALRAKAEKLEDTLHSFNIDAQVTNVTQGPAVTRYEVHPNSGVKVKGIKNLADDIALNMEAKSIRIEAPIPGKAAVGIEIENDRINMVTVREIIDSAAFKKSESKITFAVGKDIAGKAIVADLKSMPHMLIAGSTGSGKSVCINSIITSILYKATPDEVKLVLIDPKVVELANYNGIPHLLIPVVTDPAKAAAALNWAVAEMDERYRRFAEEGVRELSSYNRTMKEKDEADKVMPQVVIIIDELADLMMAAPSQVEESICRLAQKARAAGMHLIVATQRPSVDVITGVIKANIPSRIAFAVSSQFDSRTILDMAGAEKLVGKGDMLFNPLGSGKPVRVQGTFISDQEVHDVIEFVKSQVEEAEYSENVMDTIERANMPDCEKGNRDLEDELLPEAVELVVQAQQASVSMLQRRFRIGYNRAARIVDMMEDRQIIGPADGSRPRQVLLTEAELESMKTETEDME